MSRQADKGEVIPMCQSFYAGDKETIEVLLISGNRTVLSYSYLSIATVIRSEGTW